MASEKYDINVEVSQYRPLRTPGAMRAFFTLTLQPHSVTYFDCRFFLTSDGRMWFTFPQKEIKPRDGETKSQYIPVVSIKDRAYQEALQQAVLTELKKADKAVSNGKANESNAQAASTDDLPF